MNLQGIDPGARLVTVSGDVVQLLEPSTDGVTARVCYVELLGGADAAVGTETTLSADDIATVEGNRFVGPGRTASYTGDSRA